MLPECQATVIAILLPMQKLFGDKCFTVGQIICH